MLVGQVVVSKEITVVCLVQSLEGEDLCQFYVAFGIVRQKCISALLSEDHHFTNTNSLLSACCAWCQVFTCAIVFQAKLDPFCQTKYFYFGRHNEMSLETQTRPSYVY